MPARQASFGGVAALFGDDTGAEDGFGSSSIVTSSPAAATTTKEKDHNTGRRQASFGGVASLFGDDDGGDKGDSNKEENNKDDKGPSGTSRRAPSFGGVANLFGSSGDNVESTPKVSKGREAKARQPSFGGVAALFGDDDEEPAPVVTSTKKHKSQPQNSGQRRQASFGGVAALFGDEEGGPAAPSGPPAKSSKKRDPSFSGVANLFGDEEDDEQEEEVQPNSSSNFKSGIDNIGALRELPKVNRTKKRDPSFGGVADLFKDENLEDDDENVEENAPKVTIKINPKIRTQDKQISKLQTEVELHREKAIELEGELDHVCQKNEKLQKELETLREEKKELLVSKIRLITNTAEEIQRMRELMHEMSEANRK